MTTAYDQVVVNVPHLELKKFKAIVKALGFTIEKKTELQRSIGEVEKGEVIKCNSLAELINADELNYYNSEQFQKDLDESEHEIQQGNCVSTDSSADIHALLFG